MILLIFLKCHRNQKIIWFKSYSTVQFLIKGLITPEPKTLDLIASLHTLYVSSSYDQWSKRAAKL